MDFSLYSISVEGIFVRRYLVLKEDHPFLIVKRKVWYSSREFLFSDMTGNIILKIIRPFSFFSFKFNLFKDGKQIGIVEKKALSRQYEMESERGNYSLSGDFFGTEYFVHKYQQEVAKVSRKIFRRDKHIGLAIKAGFDDEIIIAMVIISDIVRQLQKQKSA